MRKVFESDCAGRHGADREPEGAAEGCGRDDGMISNTDLSPATEGSGSGGWRRGSLMDDHYALSLYYSRRPHYLQRLEPSADDSIGYLYN